MTQATVALTIPERAPEPTNAHVGHVGPKPPPAPEPQSDGSSSLVLAALLSGAVVAALIAAAVNTALARRKSLEEERARVRTVFAEAFEAVSAYKEFPYAIRRRRADAPAEERVRLSEELRKVQTRLTYYLAWTRAESQAVGDAYEALVTELRRLAGGACRDVVGRAHHRGPRDEHGAATGGSLDAGGPRARLHAGRSDLPERIPQVRPPLAPLGMTSQARPNRRQR